MKTIERFLFTLGLTLALVAGLLGAWGERGQRQGVAAFAQLRAVARTAPTAGVAVAGIAPASKPAAPQPTVTSAGDGLPVATPDGTIAILRIPGIALEVPVRRGTGGSVLVRGAGLIEGSAPPGSDGNIAIAAHRDGFFRGLRELAIGDLVELQDRVGTRRYRITHLSVVPPTAVGVLDEVGAPVITLVTCFPFTFIGRAPQRFIVRGVAEGGRT
jgi:sortase A